MSHVNAILSFGARTSIIVCALILHTTLISRGADEPAPAPPNEPSVGLELERRELLPFEPITYLITVTNRNTGVVAVSSVWDHYAFLEYKPSDHGRWTRIGIWWRPRAFIVGKPTSLQPGQSQHLRFWAYSFAPDRRAIFEPGKEYTIRATIPSTGSAPALISNEVKLLALAATDAEKKPLEQLLSVGAKGDLWDSLLMSLLPESRAADAKARQFRQIDDFVKAFPDSAYSIYLRRTFVALACEPDVSDADVRERARSHYKVLQKIAPWAVSDQWEKAL